ncbi:hypothetical protein [Cupriavidus pinatubonensis]|uniref:hypothetical protein n=1 Tax=Cupriavidus pinatubonensis TaxID=248026 RepID=UPI003610FDA8
MDAVDKFELERHGVYPIAFDRRWHCGTHLAPNDQTEAVRAIADGEVVAYRVSQTAISDGQTKSDGNPALNSNNGFVLLKHKTDTGEGRTITFYSLYMHLLDMNAQQIIAPQPIQPPATGSANALPAWLLHPTDGVQAGGTKKVYRKDMLGYWGNCHGQPHLHFEIFMAEEDFGSYFGSTQLGNTAPTTPTSKDYWGHSYYVIPGGQAFASVPPGITGSPYFPVLKNGALDAQCKLYVEAYFHRGQRYTRSWIETEGNLTLLTPRPVADPYADYEYKLYERATALYPSCPSAGYEMLRFGRALSAELPPLSPAESRAWVAVTFNASGEQGYLDIGQGVVKKLSDADFPFFTGWRKIDEANTPFSADGVCDYVELRRIVDVVEASETPAQRKEEEHKQEDRLTAYVYGNDAVRANLRGFVCHAPSEWDATGNEARHARLNQPDGFFGKRKDIDPNGYENFIKFLEKLQFLDKVPSLSGNKKFWFFHPLAFIRHFRGCGWLSEKEIYQLIPAKIIRKPGSHNSPSSGIFESPVLVKTFINKHHLELNKALQKYSLTTSIRQACFFGNATQETVWFSDLRESGGSTPNLHLGWYGRGFLQLTNKDGNLNNGNNNYYKYFKFLGRHPRTPAGTHEIQWRDQIGVNPFHASQSAMAYWVWPNKSTRDPFDASIPQVDSANIYADNANILTSNIRKTINTNNGSKVWYYNQWFTNCATAVNYPAATERTPPNMNGLVDRSTAFSNALVVLGDLNSFPTESGSPSRIPEGFERRNVL